MVQHRLYSVVIILALTLTGLTLLALPTITETNAMEFSAQVTRTELDAPIGYAPPGYSVDAQISSQNQVTVTLKLLGSSGTSTIIFSQVFSAGSFDISAITIVNGGNVFLTVTPQNSVYTQMTVFARIFQNTVTYQYSWIGILVLGAAGLFALAALFPETVLGRAAGKVIPVRRIGLVQ
jgi:hypothetical protein